MKNTSRILLFLVPAVLASQFCLAAPPSGGLRTEEVVRVLLFILVAPMVVAAAPVVSYLSYKRPGRQLNVTAWVLAIITKLACLIVIARSGGNYYAQLGALAGVLPNFSIYLLLLKAERNLSGRRFQLAFFAHSILGILIAGSLFSLVLSRFIFLGNISIYHVFSGLARFGVTVWFVYQYLKSAAAKGVTFAPGLLHPFVWGLGINVLLYISSRLILLMVFVQWKPDNLSGITNISFSMPIENLLLVANALLSGVAAYLLFNQKTKNVG